MYVQNGSRWGGIALLAALCVAGCSGGGGGGGPGGGGGGGNNPPPTTPPPAPPVNRAPVASNDVLRVEPATLNNIAILANDTDPDGDPLTITVQEPPPVGVVVANTDGTVRLQSLPAGFKGVTRFKYRITDAAGLTSDAAAALFIGTDPFRVLFVGDAQANNSPEVFLANFLAAPTAVTAATEGTRRLRGFSASDNGATVAYRRVDTASTPGAPDLSFVRTATPATQVRITLPGGTTLTQDGSGLDQYRVSPDGNWIVFIAQDTANATAAYTLNVATPTTVSKVNIAGAQFATLPRFSRDSRFLYLLASPTTNGANKSLYAIELGTTNVATISAPNPAGSTDNVIDYSVSSDQTRILIRANRAGREGLFFIDATQLQTEKKVTHDLGLTEQLLESTISLPQGLGGSVGGLRVGYTTKTDVPLTFDIYIAEVSAANSRVRVVSSLNTPVVLLGLRPDNAAVVYTRGGQIYEKDIDPAKPEQLMGGGASAWYDSTSNIVLLGQSLPAGGSMYPALAVTLRGSFPNTTPLGTPVLAARYSDVSGFDHAVVVLGEGATTGSAPTNARLALVNAVAGDKLIYLAEFQSPLQLTSPVAQVVTN